MLICDVCTSAYSLYRQHEEVCNAFSYRIEGQNGAVFKPQVCYTCARRIDDVTKQVFCKPIQEE